MHSTLRTKLFFSFFLLLLLGLALPYFFLANRMQNAVLNEATDNAFREAEMAQLLLPSPALTEAQAEQALQRLATLLDIRITYIAENGTIEFESGPADKTQMDRHSDREEIRMALQNGSGMSIRKSETSGQSLLYAAIKIDGAAPWSAGVLRVARPLAVVQNKATSLISAWLGIFALAFALSLILAWLFSRRLENSFQGMIHIVGHMAQGKKERLPSLPALPGKEFAALAAAVNCMADTMEKNLQLVERHNTQLESILNTMAEGVLVVDAKGRTQKINQALCRLFPQVEEFLLHQQVTGKKPVEFLGIAAIQEELDTLLRGDAPNSLTLEIDIQSSHHPRVFNVHLVKPENTTHVGAVLVFHDITEMADLMRMRRDFIANASHELRTPLTVIQGYSETLLSMEQQEAANARFLETIHKQAVHMSRIVEDLLTLSRIENRQGRAPLSTENIQAEPFMRSLAESYNPILKDKELSISCQIQEDLCVNADAHLLAQVVQNLLDNACRYAPEHSTLTVKGAVSPTEPKMALFSVQDEGPGIPAGEARKVFERFYRVEKHRGNAGNTGSNGQKQGTGLGLAICKHIVEMHGGRIWAEEKPAQSNPNTLAGATLCFTLPLCF